MPIRITVEVVYQPVDGEPRKDTIKMGIGDHYATGLQHAGLLFKIVKLEIPATEYFEVAETRKERHESPNL